jgi:hypothetical protein
MELGREYREVERERDATQGDVVPLAPGGAERYRRLAQQLPGLLKALCQAPDVRRTMAPIPAKPGVYLFIEDGRPVYVGQTRNLRRRLSQHGTAWGRHNQATFAFARARQEASLGAETETRSREELESDPRFAAIFRHHRDRVASMPARIIEVDDPELRTVFEVYATIMLGTENTFETH